jgi:hypothetical protein
MTMTDTTASSRLPSTNSVAGSTAGRRRFLRVTGTATLALGTAALLSGCETWDSLLDNPPPPRGGAQGQAQQQAGQQPRPDLAADAQILNAMLRTEQSLNAATLRAQADVLRMLARAEQSTANAYLGQVGTFQDRRLATIASRLAADDVMHWTALAGLMQEQLPGNALSFGT